jgi:hypothetical protein
MPKSESPQRRGGLARAKSVDKARRSEIARKAANARWHPEAQTAGKSKVKTKPKTPVPEKAKPDFAPGTMGCHELLHMAAYLTHAIDAEIMGHPALAQRPKWRKHALKALNAMSDLYQAIGAEHLSST